MLYLILSCSVNRREGTHMFLLPYNTRSTPEYQSEVGPRPHRRRFSPVAVSRIETSAHHFQRRHDSGSDRVGSYTDVERPKNTRNHPLS